MQIKINPARGQGVLSGSHPAAHNPVLELHGVAPSCIDNIVYHTSRTIFLAENAFLSIKTLYDETLRSTPTNTRLPAMARLRVSVCNRKAAN